MAVCPKNPVEAELVFEGLLEVRLGNVDLTAEVTSGQQMPPGTYVKLTVRDTGCGMPPEVMEKDIMSRLERWTGQSVGIEHQEAKAMQSVCVVKDFARIVS